MANKKEKKKGENTWWDRFNKEYRLSVFDDETLVQINSFYGSKFKLATIVLTLAILSGILALALVSFTPLRQFIPGYGDVEQNTKYLELRDDLVDMQGQMEVQQTYIDGLQKMLAGDISDMKDNSTEVAASTPPAKPVAVQTIGTKEVKASTRAKGLTMSYLVAPVLGPISAPFDAETDHLGVDILAKKGEPIKSAAAGVVINSDWSIDAGNTISVQHPNNIVTVYKHNSALLKKTGDIVKAGEAIAIIGNTGTLTDGPHLHFELWYNGNAVDPASFINF